MKSLLPFGIAASGLLTLAHAMQYEHTVSLDDAGRAKMSWTIKDDTFHLKLDFATTGWVGFGLSPGSSMLEADMAVAWFDSATNTPYVQDRNTMGFASRTMPALDASQDWEIDTDSGTAAESLGRTVVHLRRQVRTCDKEDHEVPVGTARVIWALGPDGSDPDGATGDIRAHALFGRVSVDLFSRDPRTVKSVSELDDADTTILSVQTGAAAVALPAEDTYYHCRAITIADEDRGRHMVAAGVKVQGGNERHVHHVLMYECDGDFDAQERAFDGPCHGGNMPSTLRDCNGGKPVAAWAIGGDVLVLPQNTGIPISQKYYLLETHYDNPDKVAGVTDASAMELLLRAKDKPASIEAQITTIGAVPGGQVIPGKAKDARMHFLCGGECTKSWPKITAHGTFLHAHLAGRGIRLRHFRDGAELRPIAVDDTYDFNLQTFKMHDAVDIQPGDELLAECNYDTTDRDTTVWGGLSTTEEMCIAYVITTSSTGVQNPSVCWTYPDPGAYLKTFGAFLIESGAAPEDEISAGLLKIYQTEDNDERDKIFASIGVTWTPEQQESFISAYNVARQYTTCEKGVTVDPSNTLKYRPYVPEPVCPGDPTPYPADWKYDDGASPSPDSSSAPGPLRASVAVASLLAFAVMILV